MFFCDLGAAVITSAASATSPGGFGSRDQGKGFWSRLGRIWKLVFQAVIKSAASAASRKTKTQESRGGQGRRLGKRTAGHG